MRNFIMTALLVLFSINGLATAAEDDIFEIEAAGSYQMEDDSSVDLAKAVANRDDLSEPSGKKIPELGQHLYGQSHNKLYFA